jgi:hypothetical protein
MKFHKIIEDGGEGNGKQKQKPSLFGSVRGGDVTDEMIDVAKKDLFRELEEIK